LRASLKKMSPMDPVRRKFQDVTNFYGQMAEMDAQGRLLIPQKLREMAKVTGDVEVLGVADAAGGCEQRGLHQHDDQGHGRGRVDGRGPEFVCGKDERDVARDEFAGEQEFGLAPRGSTEADGMNKPQHVPVLLDEVLQYLNVRPGGVIADATVGLGGHSSEIAKRLGATGRLICFDRDPQAMELAKSRMDEVRAELGDAMPEVVYEPRAFSELAGAIAAGESGWIAGRLWRKQPAVGRGTERIQFSVGRPPGHAGWTRAAERRPGKW